MTTRSNPDTADTPSAPFESALERVVLKAFADGVNIVGTWDVTSSSSFVPAWRVTIERIDDADLPEDDPSFLDE